MKLTRDLEYEENNKAYDIQYTEEDGGGIKCKNYNLCEDVLSPDTFEYFGNYLYMHCSRVFNWGELEFRDSKDECIVCNETDIKQMKFPTNCGHWFCVNCSRNILFWDETKYKLSPESYGCPRCPNGCINPQRGFQCYCEDYDEIKDTWEQGNPNQFERWNIEETISIQNGEDSEGSVYCSLKCPLCRKKYINPSF